MWSVDIYISRIWNCLHFAVFKICYQVTAVAQSGYTANQAACCNPIGIHTDIITEATLGTCQNGGAKLFGSPKEMLYSVRATIKYSNGGK